MLRTNSKQARENVRAYILKNFDAIGAGYDDPPAENAPFSEVARFILLNFRAEVFNTANIRRYFCNNEQTAFIYWCSGLPSLLDTCYYYNRSACADLGAILEQTEQERARYTEAQAEEVLTTLIYREILKGERER